MQLCRCRFFLIYWGSRRMTLQSLPLKS